VARQRYNSNIIILLSVFVVTRINRFPCGKKRRAEESESNRDSKGTGRQRSLGEGGKRKGARKITLSERQQLENPGNWRERMLEVEEIKSGVYRDLAWLKSGAGEGGGWAVLT